MAFRIANTRTLRSKFFLFVVVIVISLSLSRIVLFVLAYNFLTQHLSRSVIASASGAGAEGGRVESELHYLSECNTKHSPTQNTGSPPLACSIPLGEILHQIEILSPGLDCRRESGNQGQGTKPPLSVRTVRTDGKTQ